MYLSNERKETMHSDKFVSSWKDDVYHRTFGEEELQQLSPDSAESLEGVMELSDEMLEYVRGGQGAQPMLNLGLNLNINLGLNIGIGLG
jgi:mersacidin/lichenicidin family type 2 lantibiotic